MKSIRKFKVFGEKREKNDRVRFASGHCLWVMDECSILHKQATKNRAEFDVFAIKFIDK
jgi:hypothetical protein